MSGRRAPGPRGVWATVLLDVGPDGCIRLSAIEEQVCHLAEAGVDGVYCCGTAGEFHVVGEGMFRDVAAATAEAARRHGLPFQIGASHPMPQAALERIEAAATLGPDAVQVILPDWAPLDRAGAIRFLTSCSDASGDAAIVLYHPPHSRSPLGPADLLSLAAADAGLVGLKTGGGDEDWFAAMRPVMDRLSVFVPGHRYASGVLAGAHGAYSNLACLSPQGAVRWARLVRDDPAAARALEDRVAQFMARAIGPRIARGLPAYACDKLMAAAGGWCAIASRLLWPYEGASGADVAEVRVAAREILPDLLDMAPATK